MADRESVITHLQIIHTWASFARERDLQFFTAKHLEDIAQWSDDALNLLQDYKVLEKQHEISNELLKLNRRTGKWERQYSRPGVYANLFWWCSVCGEPTRYNDAGIFYKYCPHCGAKLEPCIET